MRATWGSFYQYHRDNPGLYKRLVSMAYGLKAKGFTRYGMAGLFEVIRYENCSRYGEDFKIDNYYRAAYARLIMQKEPGLEGFFTTRRSKLDDERTLNNAGRSANTAEGSSRSTEHTRKYGIEDATGRDAARCPYDGLPMAGLRFRPGSGG